MTGLLAQQRLVLTSALLLALLGVAFWLTMPRQEDPTMPRRFGLVVAPYPGADARKVERLVLEPLEEELARVEEVKTVQASARPGVAVLNVELEPGLDDLTAAWDEVQRALERSRPELPEGVVVPTVDRDTQDVESIVLAISGSPDRLLLLDGARKLEKALLGITSVSRVVTSGAPEEQVVIEYDDASARRFGIDPRSLASQLAARNANLPGGAIRIGGQTAPLEPSAELIDARDVARAPIALPSGATVPLADLARVRRAAAAPELERLRHQGSPAITLGVVPKLGINAVQFGDQVRARVAATELGGLQVDEVTFQPARVEHRLTDLGQSLQLGIAIVAVVLLLFMGLRLGLVVAAVVPLVALASLAVYALGGGVLHQMSISALVIALGMLVDNAIVVAENVQRKLDEGVERRQAVAQSVRELALPLFAATGTTLAAFVPMLLSQGPTADFTRAIPIVIMLTLAISYGYAVLVTPVLAAMVLKPKPLVGESRFDQLSGALARLALRRRSLVLTGALLLVGGSVAAASQLEQQFFPSADREQLVVSLELPEGSHIDQTDAALSRLEAELARQPEVRSITAVVGRGVPRLYYNLLSRPQNPQLGQLFVTTDSPQSVPRVLDHTRRFVREQLPEAEVIARGLEQGPPIEAPIQVRLYAEDPVLLTETAGEVLEQIRSIPGTRDVRHDAGSGLPRVRFEVDDAVAARYRSSRSDVALALLGRTHGLSVGDLKSGEDPVPIVIRGSAGEDLTPAGTWPLQASRRCRSSSSPPRTWSGNPP